MADNKSYRTESRKTPLVFSIVNYGYVRRAARTIALNHLKIPLSISENLSGTRNLKHYAEKKAEKDRNSIACRLFIILEIEYNLNTKY